MARAARRTAMVLALALAPAAAIAEPLVIEIESAEAAYDSRTSEPLVTFRMKDGSRQAFAEMTRKNVGRPMEIRIDGRALMKPLIREPIDGGVGQVSGNMTAADARSIAQRLQAGTARLEIEIVD